MTIMSMGLPRLFDEFSAAFFAEFVEDIIGVFGGLIGGGAHDEVGDSIESSVLQLSLSLSGSQIIEGKRPCFPALLPVFTIPFHQPSSTPLGIRLSILILSPDLKDISSEPVAS